MRLSRAVYLILFSGLLAACTTSRPYVSSDFRSEAEAPAAPTYRVFLVGNVGAAEAAPGLALLQARLAGAGEDAAVVFLGDNLSGGLPDSSEARRGEAEARLRRLADAVRGHPGRIVFLPGDGDWDDGSPDGLEALQRQEAFIEQLFDGKNVFRPDDGFPGPVDIKLTDHLTLVVLGTPWWLHPHERPFGDADDYDLEEEGDFLLELDDMVRRNRRKDLLVVGHHPLYSNGRYRGFYPLRDHLFPLARVVPGAYIPLPILGSLPILYRRSFGGRQDLAHPRYRALRRRLGQIFERHAGLVYAAAHDHSLQYFPHHEQHFLVSGSAARAEPVARGHGAAFAAGTEGLMELRYYDDGSVWLAAWSTDDTADPIFQTQIEGPARDRENPDLPASNDTFPDYRDSVAVAVPDPVYAAGSFKRFLWGDLHRDAWLMPVEVPYLDIGAEGLTPVRRGGSAQSTGLRMVDANGREYMLRSVRKDPSKALPEALRQTFAGAVSRDLAASQHPLGAYLVPPLAEAAGIYHARPRLVYVPRDPRLGIYRDDIGGQLMHLEIRPNGDMRDLANFGRTRDVVGTSSMYRRVTNDNDHRVEQRALARARLFDMLLSDWDRHNDQWRWATFEPYELDSTLTGDARKEGKIYRPIPRDRDTAFNILDGLLPGLAKPFLKYQDFRPSYGNLRGLTLNAWQQDHRFTNTLDRQDWIDLADSLRLALSDEVIEDALRRWPDNFYDAKGREFIETLKIRRDKLPEIAGDFYDLHVHSVDVVGSHKHERFEVTRLSDEETEVVMYKITKKGKIRRELFRRTFRRGETKEILLYGLGGDDQFEITGEVGRGITVAAIGGSGEDTFVDRSRVGGWGRKTRFYDTRAGNDFTPGSEAKVFATDDPAVNRYDAAVRYDTLAPQIVVGSERDQGLTIGGGVKWRKHRLRKRPYARSHALTVTYSLGAQAFGADYRGHFVADLGGWDVVMAARWRGPNAIRNFFGFGNDTINPEEARGEAFNQARLSRLALAPALLKRPVPGFHVQFGPLLEYTDVSRDGDRFVSRPEAGVAAATFGGLWYGGAGAGFELRQTDRAVNPRQGFRWATDTALLAALGEGEGPFGTVTSDLVLYLSASFHPQVTLALRAGGAHTEGDFPFYHANTLGGRRNLRGYRNDRFAGRSRLYQNAELRVGLLRLDSYLVLGELGVLGFFDNGRVWADGENSSTWHQGYGGGPWLSLFDRFVVTATYGVSEDEDSFSLRLGFLY